MAGLVLIVAFSALVGSSGSIAQIVGFRVGWGLGNALFIATSLAVIIGSASGAFAGAIVLYETALFGVTTLMAMALIATPVLVRKTPVPAYKQSLTAPIRALRHRGLLTMGLTALLYNWGFFTVLGFAPFPMHLDTHQLGIAFTGSLFAADIAGAVHRRRPGAVCRRQDGRALGRAPAVLRRRPERAARATPGV